MWCGVVCMAWANSLDTDPLAAHAFVHRHCTNALQCEDDRHPECCPRQARLSFEQQRTMVTLWSIARSPLFIGGDPATLTDPEASLLTNTEVLAANAQGRTPRQIAASPNVETACLPVANARYLWDAPSQLVVCVNCGRVCACVCVCVCLWLVSCLILRPSACLVAYPPPSLSLSLSLSLSFSFENGAAAHLLCPPRERSGVFLLPRNGNMCAEAQPVDTR